MRTVFADTFYFLALLNRRDQWHEQAVQLSRRGGFAIVTTRAVLLEVADALAHPMTRPLAGEFLGELDTDANVEIVALDEALCGRALDLYREREDKHWTLTDCISFVVMRGRGITEALTGDRDFRQAGYTTLLGSG